MQLRDTPKPCPAAFGGTVHTWMFMRNESLGQFSQTFPGASGFRRYYCQYCLIETTQLHYDGPQEN